MTHYVRCEHISCRSISGMLEFLDIEHIVKFLYSRCYSSIDLNMYCDRHMRLSPEFPSQIMRFLIKAI